MQSAPIILLKEGTDTSQGRPQIVSNINACQVIADAIRTTLGPRGMDKLIVDGHGQCVIMQQPRIFVFTCTWIVSCSITSLNIIAL